MRANFVFFLVLSVLCVCSSEPCSKYGTCAYKRAIYVDGETKLIEVLGNNTVSHETCPDEDCTKPYPTNEACKYESYGSMLFSNEALLSTWTEVASCVVKTGNGSYWLGDFAFWDFFKENIGRPAAKGMQLTRVETCEPLEPEYEDDFHNALSSFSSLKFEGCGVDIDTSDMRADLVDCKEAWVERPAGTWLNSLKIWFSSTWECDERFTIFTQKKVACGLKVTYVDVEAKWADAPPTTMKVEWVFRDFGFSNAPSLILLICMIAIALLA